MRIAPIIGGMPFERNPVLRIRLGVRGRQPKIALITSITGPDDARIWRGCCSTRLHGARRILGADADFCQTVSNTPMTCAHARI